MLYGLKLDEEAGLQVICSSEGVAFEQLPELVFEVEGLSEFEQHRAARLLQGVSRRPCTTVTNLSHLIKEPMMSFRSQPEDAVQYKMEIYQLPDKSAEIVMEYPNNNAPMPWFALMAQKESSAKSSDTKETHAKDQVVTEPVNQESRLLGLQAWESNCERLTFALSEQEMLSLLSLCRSVSQG